MLGSVTVNLYRVVLPLGLAAAVIGWISGPTTVYGKLGYPALSCLMAILVVLIYRRSETAVWVERVLITVLSLHLSIGLGVLTATGDLSTLATELLPMVGWMPILFIVSFLAFGTRTARLLALSYCGLTTAIALVGCLTRGLHRSDPELVKALLMQLALAHPIYVILLATMGRLASALRESRRKITQLSDVAYHDSLTGLTNRPGADLIAECIDCDPGGGPISLAVIDLDGFKRINDTQGHQAGDRVLRSAGRTIEAHIRTGDFGIRWGGDEFVVVLPGCHAEAAHERMEQIRHAFAAVPDLAGQVQMSIGLVSSYEAMTFSALVRTADDAMYQAKRAGGDQVIGAVVPSPPVSSARSLD